MSIPRKSLGKTTEYSVTDLHFICTMKKFIGSKITGHVPGGWKSQLSY